MKTKKLSAVRAAVRDHLRNAAVAYLVLLISLLLTALVWRYVSENVEAQESLRFEETVEATREAIDQRMDTYLDAMFAGRGLFAASESVERDEWRDYIAGSEIERRYPGIQLIGYAEYVSQEEKDAHVDRVREEGFPDYALRPRIEQPEYFPVSYIYPLDKANRTRFGYDRYRNPTHRAVMDEARDTSSPRATGKVPVFSEASPGSLADLSLQPGIVVYLPIYRDGEPPGNVAERRQALEGFIVSEFRADALLEGIFGERVDPAIDFEVYDGDDLIPGNLLYDDDGIRRAREDDSAPRFSHLTEIDVAGQTWSLSFSTLPGFEQYPQRNLPLFVLLSGLAISLLLFGVTWMLGRSRTLAKRVGATLEVTNKGLEDANRELQAANKELEAFSYSVSHDLRTPLRSIDGFSQILLKNHAEDLDEQGRDYLGRVGRASQRMGELIDDLLGLSRVTRAELEHKVVDLSALAKGVAAELQRSQPERRVRFEINEGLVAEGDAKLLRVVLENLLGNAWKFTGKKGEGARIEFGAERRAEGQVYYVRDDGAGFEMAYADKLFGAFQRLHGANEFEGTGIGLATVRRVVERHGGRVWAEGEVGEGATFYFTLPKKGGA